MLYDVSIDGRNHHLELERTDTGWLCRLDGSVVNLDAVLSQPNVLSILVRGRVYEVRRELAKSGWNIWVGSERYSVKVRDPRSLRSRRDGGVDDLGPKKIVAPMPGKVVRLLVEEGAEIQIGQGVLVVEAMKMQNEIKSPKKGIVQKFVAAEGATVNAGDVLAIVE